MDPSTRPPRLDQKPESGIPNLEGTKGFPGSGGRE